MDGPVARKVIPIGEKGNEAEAPPKPKAKPLPAYLIDEYTPSWTRRPRSFVALRDLPPAALQTWQLIHSANGTTFRPCFHNRDQLGETIGKSVGTVKTHLRELRKAGLIFEVPRGIDPATRQHRPPARWALDPLKVDVWGTQYAPERMDLSNGRIRMDRGAVIGRGPIYARLAEMAQERETATVEWQDTYWFQAAERALKKHEARARYLATKLREDAPAKKQNKRRKKKSQNKLTMGRGQK